MTMITQPWVMTTWTTTETATPPTGPTTSYSILKTSLLMTVRKQMFMSPAGAPWGRMLQLRLWNWNMGLKPNKQG